MSKVVIVYDDGAADDTREAAVSAGETVIRSNENKGYGAAIRSLFQTAKEKGNNIMLTLDSDVQHNPEQIPSLIEQLKHGCV